MGSDLVDQKHEGRGTFVRHIGDFAGNPACEADGRVEPPSLKKRIMSFRVAIASLKLWLDEISVDVQLEFSLQRGLGGLVA